MILLLQAATPAVPTGIPTQLWYIILAAIPAITAAILSFVGIILTHRNKAKIEEIHISINSRMDELLKITGSAAFAKGRREGVDATASAILTPFVPGTSTTTTPKT